MPNTTTSEVVFGLSEALREPERTLRAGHFLRQSIITQRKLASSVNRRWCENQRFITKHDPWTP